MWVRNLPGKVKLTSISHAVGTVEDIEISVLPPRDRERRSELDSSRRQRALA